MSLKPLPAETGVSRVIYSVHVKTRKSASEAILIQAAFRRCEVFGFSRVQSIVVETCGYVATSGVVWGRLDTAALGVGGSG